MKYLIALGKVLLTIPVSLLIAHFVEDEVAANTLAFIAGVPFGLWAGFGLAEST